MPIVSSTFSATTQADGSRNVIETHVDQDGTPYNRSYNVPAVVDIQTIVNNYGAALSEQLAQQEFEALIGG